MRTIILFTMLSGAVCLSCTNERQQFQPEATPDRKSAIIGGNDTVTSIQVASADKDTVIYDTPECYLWYVEDLPDKYKDVVEQWNGKEWVMAKTKGDIVWQDDGFEIPKAPLLYCFRFPVSRDYYLPKGKYRIRKSFHAKRENIELSATFEIK